MTQNEALKLALEAFETLTQYNMVRANIFRRFEPTCTGDYVDLREFREKAKPAITAIKEALSSPNGEAQPEQEPVAKFDARQDAERLKSVGRGMSYNDVGEAVWKHTLMEIAMRLETGGYTTPPQRKPLTYVDLRRIANQCGLGANEVSARTQATVDNYARAIEAAHGIKE